MVVHLQPYRDTTATTIYRRSSFVKGTFHTLRHTFASHLVMAGVDLRTVQELLGHKTIQMTMRYAHLSPDRLEAAMQRYGSNMAQLAICHDDVLPKSSSVVVSQTEKS